MTTVEALRLAVKTLDRLAWDCDPTDHDEAERLWEATELLADVIDRGIVDGWRMPQRRPQ